MDESKLFFKLNFKPSPHDDRDFKLKITNNKLRLSSSVDLSNKCTSIKNQGGVGSCTAQACVAAFEFIEKNFNNNKENDIFSEKFTYYASRVNILGWDKNEDSGCYIRDTIKSLIKYGACKENTFPYIKPGQTDCDYTETPSVNAYNEAKKFQLLTYAQVDDDTGIKDEAGLLKIKTVLDNGYPVIGGFVCFSNIWSAVNGVIPPPMTNTNIIGGHAVLIVGYNDQTKLFKFKNSWGTGWGDSACMGYGYLPYDYYLKGYLNDIWVVYTQEDNDKAIGVITPETKKAARANKMKEILQFLTDNSDRLSDLNNYMSVFRDLEATLEKGDKYIPIIRVLRTFLIRCNYLPEN